MSSDVSVKCCDLQNTVWQVLSLPPEVIALVVSFSTIVSGQLFSSGGKGSQIVVVCACILISPYASSVRLAVT